MTAKATFTTVFLLLYLCSFGQKTHTLLFVGSYTDEKPATGIYVYDFDPAAGSVKKLYTVQGIINPSFIAIVPGGGYLYSCSDTHMPVPGSVSAFKIDSISGKLSFINKQSAGGENPVYLTVYEDGKWVVNGNYSGGSVCAFPVNADGSLKPYRQLIKFNGKGKDTIRQEKPHIHSTVFAPDYSHIFLQDLGTDEIRAFRFDTTETLPLVQLDAENIHTPAGSGPRHLTFHPNGKFAYCVEELSGTLAFYTYGHGILKFKQRVSSYAAKQQAYGSADIHISPDGRFLYTSNRMFENNIAIFSINQQTGNLTLIGHQSTYGDHPRNFAIDPTGGYLLVANQETDNIVIFKRDMESGLLKKMTVSIKVHKPSCLQMRIYR